MDKSIKNNYSAEPITIENPNMGDVKSVVIENTKLIIGYKTANISLNYNWC